MAIAIYEVPHLTVVTSSPWINFLHLYNMFSGQDGVAILRSVVMHLLHHQFV